MPSPKYWTSSFKKELANHVWGDASENIQHMVYLSIYRIRLKLEINTRTPKYLLAVKGYGYILNGCFIEVSSGIDILKKL
ncbi:hypothetical protein AAC03nite_17140 [Alicyclobacillus acidoterrestris]|uniref:winged helix-turn-helix domain-containing protein n=1 Tax=Alicyclobacillus suci TaxID=2816080 RepID=UPI00118ECCEC|nr:hypothetical protein AAC03nite_17140 [Alicyclobacillus acidoterrestris]